jgi:hypothetical protein
MKNQKNPIFKALERGNLIPITVYRDGIGSFPPWATVEMKAFFDKQ